MIPCNLVVALLPLLIPYQAPGGGAEREVEAGFVPLFDGQSLDGWVTRGGRYDGNALWSVEDGCIVGRQGPNGEGGLLYTERKYAAFELRLETRLDHPFDSGVFVRMAPEGKGAQVTLDWREGGEIGAIYSDGFLEHNEGGAGLFRRDEWNEVVVRCTGFDMHLEVWLNGTALIDYQLPPDSPGYAPTGLIGLQVHGERGDTGAARFRNVRVRELPLFGEGLLVTREGRVGPGDEARTAGWRPLFDGETMAGWSAGPGGARFAVENGELVFLASGGSGELRTDEDFRDFRLHLEFNCSRMANSGVFLRAARDGSNPAFSGCEVQILDDFHWEEVTGSKLKAWQFTGSLYGAVPPGDRTALRGIGEWNTYEMLYRGGRLAVALNGRTLYDVDTLALTPESGAPFAERAQRGFIGLQHHGFEKVQDRAVVRFRNVFVQPL